MGHPRPPSGPDRDRPDVERYRAAWQQVERVRDGLRHHDRGALIDQYRIDRVPHLAAQVDALDTWRRWDCGDSIDIKPLGEAIDTLLSAGGHQDGRYRTLGHSLQQWAVDAGIHLPIVDSATPTLEVAGPELEL